MKFEEHPMEQPKGPDRSRLIQQIKTLKIGSPEMNQAVAPYWIYLQNEVEKNPEQGKIVVGLEMAKLYKDAGFVFEAIDMLMNDENGLLEMAEMMGFLGLASKIYEIADRWRDETRMIFSKK